MRMYHICQCCDLVYKITTASGAVAIDTENGIDDDSSHHHALTGSITGSIINPISGRSEKITVGLCDECREEVYGSSSPWVKSHLLH